MVWGGRWEGGSEVGTYVHSWWIHVDGFQSQYSIVKWKKKSPSEFQSQFSSLYLNEIITGIKYSLKSDIDSYVLDFEGDQGIQSCYL